MYSRYDCRKIKSVLILYALIIMTIGSLFILFPLACHIYYKHFTNIAFIDGKKLVYYGTKRGMYKAFINGLFIFILLYKLVNGIYPEMNSKLIKYVSESVIIAFIGSITILKYISVYAIEHTHFMHSVDKKSFYTLSVMKLFICKSIIVIINLLSSMFFIRITYIINAIYDSSRINIDNNKLSYTLSDKLKIFKSTLLDILRIVLTLGLLIPYVVVDIKYFVIKHYHIKK